MKNFRRSLSLILCLLFICGTFTFPVNAASSDDEYRNYLISIGFPEDYADKLTDLHTLHPEWSFTPLLVTGLNSKYTWDYVIYMEVDDDPQRSLVPTSSSYKEYQHPTNTELYDAGYYQASREAVEYFMDPRNFLNEKDIFQFEELSYNQSITLEQIESSISGTFMENKKLENGKTFAEYFIEVGKELGISPLHLASRARQEQGNAGTSSQISGQAGDKLWYYYSKNIQFEDNKIVNPPSTEYRDKDLLQYNGYYNIYNINATGSGRFPILLNGMKAAQEGTPQMASAWGGDPSWNTLWKSIYGGAYKLCNSFIGNYQNTLYLQKWNVDTRSLSNTGISKNFWGQYMQNIDAALLEARTTYNSLAENNCLDCAYNFLIPVYADMPKNASPDPANGSFRYYAPSDTKYSYLTSLNGSNPKNNEFITTSISIHQGENAEISGYSVHSYGIATFEYSINGGEWVTINATNNPSISSLYPEIVTANDEKSVNSFSTNINTSALEAGDHKIALRASANYDKSSSQIDVSYYLVGIINLEVKGVAKPTVTIISPDGSSSSTTVKNGDSYTLPTAPEMSNGKTFVGWKISGNNGVKLLPAGTSFEVTGNLTISPVSIGFELLRGAAVKLDLKTTTLRFTTAIDAASLISITDIVGSQNVKHGMVFCESSYTENFIPAVLLKIGHGYTRDSALSVESNTSTLYFDCDTQGIPASDYKTSYSVSGYIDITYSNGSTSRFFTDFSFEDHSRSVSQVAAAALADTTIAYGRANREILAEMAK